ncbi:uncharacterized protein LOC124146143 [Haliotis rufescens]|uniref:uncharacterized protein LOC124146143 n=1 Tax=Haliotis rufescens TaxID=6454 RepID=UPI00201ED1A4|nr:uncharacterized protein LOC124146143 [Haliotis rufescens]XP_046372235.2 uncharacterized protein LOC124146143 [Haliotis rufescens]XP_046372236.2 uncharacterized protein LOC124146143 [Haliotis rufescens]
MKTVSKYFKMADERSLLSSAPKPPKQENDRPADQEPRQARSPKKKKVRRHRAPKTTGLDRLEEETDEEKEKKLSSREKTQVKVDDAEVEFIPSVNYIDDKKIPGVEELEKDEGEEEEKVEDFEEEDPCMTAEEKQAMYNAASIGDIDLLEDCLDKRYSDINMIWYHENLLVAALKSKQEEMAEFLIDNGVNYNYKTSLINIKDERSRAIEWYTCSCRQLAFDKGMHDIVELIDYLNGDLFSFIKPKERIPRYRRPKPPTPEPSTGGESENDASSEASKDRSEDEDETRPRRKKKKKRKDSKEEDGDKKDETDIGEEQETEKSNKSERDVSDNFDADSGHHSSDSVADTDKAEAEREDEGRKTQQSDSFRRSRTSSSRFRTGSSRCTSSILTLDARSPSPPRFRSETFMKRFMCISAASDEGYGSLSSKSSPTSAESKQKRPRVAIITLPPRGTKSSLMLRRASLHRKAEAEQEAEQPLLQRKVRIPGSYGAESRLWYQTSVPTNTNSSGNPIQTGKRADLQNINNVKNVPNRHAAHYMQMTTSAYTKRRLDPTFTKCYSSLDFVTDKLIKGPRSGNRRALPTRQTVNCPRSNTKSGKENISAKLPISDNETKIPPFRDSVVTLTRVW